MTPPAPASVDMKRTLLRLQRCLQEVATDLMATARYSTHPNMDHTVRE